MPYKSKLKYKHYQRRYQRQRKRDRRLLVINMLGCQCVWPGCDVRNPEELEFDHAEPHNKRSRQESGEWVRWSMDRVVANLHKWNLLCHEHNIAKYCNGEQIPVPDAFLG